MNKKVTFTKHKFLMVIASILDFLRRHKHKGKHDRNFSQTRWDSHRIQGAFQNKRD